MPKLQQSTLLPGIPLNQISNLSPNGVTFTLGNKTFRIDSPVVEIARTATYVRLFLVKPITWQRIAG